MIEVYVMAMVVISETYIGYLSVVVTRPNNGVVFINLFGWTWVGNDNKDMPKAKGAFGREIVLASACDTNRTVDVIGYVWVFITS